MIPRRLSYKDQQRKYKFLREKFGRSVDLKNEHFTPGSMVLFGYNAKDQESPWDRTPLSIIVGFSSKYILGINLHWAPPSIAEKIVKLLLRNNKKDLVNNESRILDLRLTRELYRLCKPIFRKYIKNRIKRKGAPIPISEWVDALGLTRAHFQNISEEEAHKLSLKKL